jgi:ABC-type multidrug transport system fused ATPase/permease subunit
VITFYLSWRLSLLLLLMLPLYLLNYHLFVPRLVKNRAKYRAKMDDISGVLQERLSSPTMVKSYAREKYETREFVSDTRESLNVANEGLRYNTSFSAASSVIQNIGSAVIYCAGCYMVVVGAMSYGSVIAFTYYALNLLAPAVRFSELFNGLQQTKVSVDRILDLLDEQPDVIEKPDAIALDKVRGEVQFDHLSFAYKPGMPVLQDINVTMRPGTVTALVGHTGSGKTTMATLLYRFYDPYEGAIRIDGHDLRELRLSSLRRHLGVVLQDTIMFNCSIADNIRYGCPAASDEQVVEAAKVAEIHEFVLTLPDGYKTKIGEGGTKLSVGERQRLAIARAVVTNPAILVLDEATSSLDTESERAIQKALAKVMRDRTCVVIAHRLSTIVTADQIIVLDKGRVIEVGTHFELMSRPEGHYRELCKQQFSDKVTTAQEDEKTRESLLQTT